MKIVTPYKQLTLEGFEITKSNRNVVFQIGSGKNVPTVIFRACASQNCWFKYSFFLPPSSLHLVTFNVSDMFFSRAFPPFAISRSPKCEKRPRSEIRKSKTER